MKRWVKRGDFNSLQAIIEKNVGMPIQEFLNPKRDPYISNLKEAAKFIRDAAEEGKKIHIVGDYDVDGDTSSSILKMGFHEAFGEMPSVRLPRRFSEGYGLKMKIIDEINDGIIVTVDNGIAALEPIKAAKKKGLDVVVIDHHQPVIDNGKVILPEADVIVDPHAIPGSEFSGYCGAGLAYRLIKELIPDSPMLVRYLVLASIATVADVMDLVGDNRNIVKDGLGAIRKRYVTLGLNTLLNLVGLSYVDEGDYGFKIGPIMNASGRLYDNGPQDVVNLLTTHVMPGEEGYDKALKETFDLGEVLIARNEERKKLSEEAESRADNIIRNRPGMSGTKPIILYDGKTSEGIIGIIAGRLAEKYCSPALVFTDSEVPGMLKGSGRTFGNVDLKALLDTASDLFVGYGGHPGAAGMSIMKEKLPALQKRLSEALEGVDFGVDPDVLYYDMEISVSQVPDIIRQLHLYAPFGQGNPSPVFKITGFECTPKGSAFFRLMGNKEQHIKFFGKEVDALGFDMKARYDEDGQPKKMEFIGVLTQNYFNGQFYNQIEIIDYRPCKNEETELKKSLADLLVFC